MDFRQEYVTTLQDLQVDKKKLIRKMEEFSSVYPVSVVVPILYSDLKRKTIKKIIDKLNECGYVTDIIIALAADNEDEYRESLRVFSKLKPSHLVVWCNGPSIKKVPNSKKKGWT